MFPRGMRPTILLAPATATWLGCGPASPSRDPEGRPAPTPQDGTGGNTSIPVAEWRYTEGALGGCAFQELVSVPILNCWGPAEHIEECRPLWSRAPLLTLMTEADAMGANRAVWRETSRLVPRPHAARRV